VKLALPKTVFIGVEMSSHVHFSNVLEVVALLFQPTKGAIIFLISHTLK